MAKRRQQKGRKHRQVNRTPRPVTRTGAARLVAAAGGPERPRPAGTPDAPTTARTSTPAASAPPAPAPAPQDAPAAPEVPAPARRTAPVVEAGDLFAPAAAGGLGRSAARTFAQLREGGPAGLALDELAERAGFQPNTVGKHLSGLAERGVAERRGDRWYATEQASAPA
ncbi:MULTISPECIES: hypothetical protein [unclassified Streptomyces]|uniref:hypothetical protein n=1 Tax=unclassified Streptomyces TaxID=2593676 RepID=UPI0010102270|nr:hypothetical protein [Streptomyces sp. GZWMJZ-114]